MKILKSDTMLRIIIVKFCGGNSAFIKKSFKFKLFGQES